MQGLAGFIFDAEVDTKDKEPPVSEILNRRKRNDVQIKNPMVKEIYGHLHNCQSQPKMREALLDCAHHQRAVVEAFRLWEKTAAKQQRLSNECREKLGEVDAYKKQLSAYIKQLKKKALSIEQYRLAVADFEHLLEEME